MILERELKDDDTEDHTNAITRVQVCGKKLSETLHTSIEIPCESPFVCHFLHVKSKRLPTTINITREHHYFMVTEE